MENIEAINLYIGNSVLKKINPLDLSGDIEKAKDHGQATLLYKFNLDKIKNCEGKIISVIFKKYENALVAIKSL